MTVEHAPNGGDSDTLTGYVYCPPDWDEARLVTPGPELSRLQQIAIESCTDIGYIRSRNTLEILGDSSADVLQAQTLINGLFFPPYTNPLHSHSESLVTDESMKPKKGWARPDRPGAWGQRRDGLRDTDVKEQRAKAFGLRKMKSEAILRHRVSQDDVLPGQGL